MQLLRRLVIVATIHNFTFSAQHIPGITNAVSDSLSRFQMDRFRQLAPDAAPNPCLLPSDVMFT